MICAGKPYVYNMTLVWTACPVDLGMTGANGTNPRHQSRHCATENDIIFVSSCVTHTHHDTNYIYITLYNKYLHIIKKYCWVKWRRDCNHIASLQSFQPFGELACFSASCFPQISSLCRARNGHWRFVGNIIVAQQGWAGSEHSWFLRSMAVVAFLIISRLKDVSNMSPLNQSQSLE